MSTVIFQNRRPVKTDTGTEKNKIFERLADFLPERILLEIKKYIFFDRADEMRLEEIRLRSGRRTCITVGGRSGRKNVKLDSLMTQQEMSAVFERMCDGSLYTYGESIINGYASIGYGIRVGICGQATVERGRIIGVYNVSGMNIRIPRSFARLDEGLCSAIVENVRSGKGVLIYSPPAQGKTTLLRSLCPILAGGDGAMRVVMIDSREEIGSFSGCDELSLDVFMGYPKAEAIMIATAYMNPEVIICDEIGGSDEAKSIAVAQNCGVPLIATAHADSICSLLRRPSVYELHAIRAFGLYVGIRISSFGAFEYEIYKREEAEAIFARDRDNDIAYERSGG